MYIGCVLVLMLHTVVLVGMGVGTDDLGFIRVVVMPVVAPMHVHVLPARVHVPVPVALRDVQQHPRTEQGHGHPGERAMGMDLGICLALALLAVSGCGDGSLGIGGADLAEIVDRGSRDLRGPPDLAEFVVGVRCGNGICGPTPIVKRLGNPQQWSSPARPPHRRSCTHGESTSSPIMPRSACSRMWQWYIHVPGAP